MQINDLNIEGKNIYIDFHLHHKNYQVNILTIGLKLKAFDYATESIFDYIKVCSIITTVLLLATNDFTIL